MIPKRNAANDPMIAQIEGIMSRDAGALLNRQSKPNVKMVVGRGVSKVGVAGY